jgi:DNA polymerase III alpha subunit
MKYDQLGRPFVNQDELCDMLYRNVDLSLENFLVRDPEQYNQSIKTLFADLPVLQKYHELDIDAEQFDNNNQNNWLMPNEYKNFDIAQWLLDQCKTDYELQRVGQELLLFQEKNLFSLLQYLKYLVDTMRQHNIIWGVGRGSSIASYVLYLIGVHRINSIYYDLPIEEFLKETK